MYVYPKIYVELDYILGINFFICAYFLFLFIIMSILKIMKKTKTFFVHDEKDFLLAGDIVRIKPCHKISKLKMYCAFLYITLCV